MGMFDTIHTGDRCGQTKAFDRLLYNLRPGDEVNRADSQYAMHEGGWLIVRGGRIEAWVDDPDPDLPRYTNGARPLHGELPDEYHYQPHTRDQAAAQLRRVREIFGAPGEVPGDEIDKYLTSQNAAARGVPDNCEICAELRAAKDRT